MLSGKGSKCDSYAPRIVVHKNNELVGEEVAQNVKVPEPVAVVSPTPSSLLDSRTSSKLLRSFPVPPCTSPTAVEIQLTPPASPAADSVQQPPTHPETSPWGVAEKTQARSSEPRANNRYLHRSLSSASVHLSRMWSKRRAAAPPPLDTVRHRPERASRQHIASIASASIPCAPKPAKPQADARPSIRVVTAPAPASNHFDTPPTTPESLPESSNSPVPYTGSSLPSSILPSTSPPTANTTYECARRQSQTKLPSPLANEDAPRQESLAQTVAFTEKIAAVKVFFETHYDGAAYHEITPRSLRRRRMELELYIHRTPPREVAYARQKFNFEESAHLRKERLLKASRLKNNRIAVAGYNPLRILGKGSFGLVRLVQETAAQDEAGAMQSHREIFAMKVIRKVEMLRSCQEAHLRAERDFLVSCAGTSRWTIPLRCAFQDRENLYLVMDYAIGGDFLGFLLRKEVISEACARFYVAEMICCIEEAHNMKWIHRDVKPDNFLIAADGHLKISDFGLAFDGHWAHTQIYYHQQRTSLLQRLGIRIHGDAEDREMDAKRNSSPMLTGMCPVGVNRNEELRQMRRRLARSVVGTSQYMAPEVVRGDYYDGRCDYWSIGIILFECVYGFTPFCREDREHTKAAILEHEAVFDWPTPPPQPISYFARDLIYWLLQEPWKRLCSFKYENPAPGPPQHVYVNDAESIKRHPFFQGIPWSELSHLTPPFVPKVKSADSTKYFESEEEILGSSADGAHWPGTPAAGQPAELDGVDGGKNAKKALKRARDRLLRDPTTAPTVLDVRKQRAFLGYTYRRPATCDFGVGG